MDLSPSKFNESDFFFLVESFTIFFEKILLNFEDKNTSAIRKHWLNFK